MWQEILTFGNFLLYCDIKILYYCILIRNNILFYVCLCYVLNLDSDLQKIVFHKSSQSKESKSESRFDGLWLWNTPTAKLWWLNVKYSDILCKSAMVTHTC